MPWPVRQEMAKMCHIGEILGNYLTDLFSIGLNFEPSLGSLWLLGKHLLL